MPNANTHEALAERIERLVQEHISETRKAAQQAVERAFAAERATPVKPSKSPRPVGGKRRTQAEVAALGERLYQTVCAKPGETMLVLAPLVGATARELHRPMSLLRRAGRIRAVGSRHATRYFPMQGDAVAT